MRRIFVLEALLIGLVGALAGWALGCALTGALGMVEIKNPMIDATRLPLVYSFLHYLVAAAALLPRRRLLPSARRPAPTRSISSGSDVSVAGPPPDLVDAAPAAEP